MAIPQSGEIPPAPPPPPTRAPHVRAKWTRMKNKIQKLTASTKKWFPLSTVFINASKKWRSGQVLFSFGFGILTAVAILNIHRNSLEDNKISAAVTNSTDGPPGLVIGVLSSRDNFMQRQAIRHTWATRLHTTQHQERLPTELVFVLGDQDCSVHPKLRSHNPNHCDPPIEYSEEPDLDNELDEEHLIERGTYSRRWQTWRPSPDPVDSKPKLHQEPCWTGLGVRTVIEVRLTEITVPYKEGMGEPSLFIARNIEGRSVEEELKLQLEERGGVTTWVTDIASRHFPAGAEFEVAVSMNDDDCSNTVGDQSGVWEDGLNSVLYTHVMDAKGSVMPWKEHHCLPFTVYFENGFEECPSNWILHGGHCYYFSRKRADWESASNRCMDSHGATSQEDSKLVMPLNDKTSAFLAKEATKLDMYGGWWIGLMSSSCPEKFQWEDGSSLEYKNWAKFEPNGLIHQNNCVEMRSTGKWNDHYCTTPNNYICQMPRMNNHSKRSFPSKAAIQSLQLSWTETHDTVEESVLREQKMFGDLLLVPGLVDTYGSLPDKLKALIQWSDATFPNYWLLKTDDDAHVSLPRVLDVISQASTASSLSGSPYATSQCPDLSPPPAVFSSFTSFRSVPRRGKNMELDYTGLSFPDFPAGGGYLLTGSVVSGLAAVAPSLRSYQGEDVSLGVWLSSLSFPCLPSTGPRPVQDAQHWLEPVVEGGRQLADRATPVLNTLKKGLVWLFEVLFLARVNTAEPSAVLEPHTPPVIIPPSPARHSPAVLINVPCWLRSKGCEDTYAVTPDLSIDKMDQLHKMSVKR